MEIKRELQKKTNVKNKFVRVQINVRIKGSVTRLTGRKLKKKIT